MKKSFKEKYWIGRPLRSRTRGQPGH